MQGQCSVHAGQARERGVRELPDDATPAAKARTLGAMYMAVAEALEDTNPTFEPQRGRLKEYVAVAGNALAGVKRKDRTLEADHVIALLLDSRDKYRNAVDGFCSAADCVTLVVTWLEAHGYSRAVAHLMKQRELAEKAIRAKSASEFNKLAAQLVNAAGFASMSVGSLKVANSRRRKRK